MRVLPGVLVALLVPAWGAAAQQIPTRLLPATERAACLAEGGRIETSGALPYEVCFRPTPDGGLACTVSADCTGHCLAETRTCSTVAPMVGCFDYLDAQGNELGLCID